MTEGRCQLKVGKLKKEAWLTRVFDPRPHADRERIIDHLCPLYGNEANLDDGRFRRYKCDRMDHCSTVDFSGIEEEGERVLQLEIMLEWIAREGGDWRMEAMPDTSLVIEFWFSEAYAANVFNLMFGGKPQRIVRD